jgi:hypothetical protein
VGIEQAAPGPEDWAQLCYLYPRSAACTLN